MRQHSATVAQSRTQRACTQPQVISSQLAARGLAQTEPRACLADVLSVAACSGGRVKLHGGSSLEYDWLVLAVGSQTNTFGIPGVREHAITFWSLDDVNQVGLSELRFVQCAQHEIRAAGQSGALPVQALPAMGGACMAQPPGVFRSGPAHLLLPGVLPLCTPWPAPWACWRTAGALPGSRQLLRAWRARRSTPRCARWRRSRASRPSWSSARAWPALSWLARWQSACRLGACRSSTQACPALVRG